MRAIVPICGSFERGDNVVPNPLDVLLWFIVFLFALSVHESAHALVSDRFGDDLGRSLGRISLNPIVHIDPIGTVLFPLMGAFTGIPLFGWAKPVPVNPLAWREKDKANFWTSAAGPLSNFALAAISFAIVAGLLLAGVVKPTYNAFVVVSGEGVLDPIAKLASFGLTVNLALGVFNLIPIPPLDGSGMLESVLPYEAQRAYEQLRPYGFMLLFALMLLGAFSFVYFPIVTTVIVALYRVGA
jgi:Zn-dependent protease